MRLWSFVALLLVLAAPASAAAFTKGQTVAARIEHSWYFATIDATRGDRYHITYGDAEATVGADQLRPMSEAADLAIGDKVIAVWKAGPKMLPGTIQARAEEGYTIAWDEGAPSVVKLGMIAKVENAPTRFRVGDSVAARHGRDWYIATIDSIRNGTYRVTYGDGQKARLTARDLRETARARDLAIGDRVLAVRGAGPKMLAGVIHGIDAQGFTIKWNDGSMPSIVPPRLIAKLGSTAPAPTHPRPTVAGYVQPQQAACAASHVCFAVSHFSAAQGSPGSS